MLREHDLSPDQIVGTGAGGRITRDDVAAFLLAGDDTGAQGPAGNGPARAGSAGAAPPKVPAQRAPAPQPAAAPAAAAQQTIDPARISFAPGEDQLLVPWTQMRRGIAAAMVRSTGTVPHAGTTVEVDATNMVRLRAAHKDSFRAREGANLSFVPFVIKAVVEALRRHPRLNAHWTEEGLLVKRRINVGIAVAVDDGLLVPVIHDADQLSISGLNRAVLDLADRARSNRLRLPDLQGGTITVNNTGSFGSVLSSSIINTPEVAIVNLEAIVKRPVVLETAAGEVIAVRSMMNVPVVFDHRATDGAQAGRFVADIKAVIEGFGPDTSIY
jgi:2-oxoisovalerate dehydrogenase E2 component (dihydrolipoyl transacylase)